MAKRRPKTVRDIFDAHEEFVDSLVDRLDARIRLIAIRASERFFRELRTRLVLDGDVILDTPGNQLVLRGSAKRFRKHLRDLGWDEIIDAFAAQLPRQLPFIADTFRAINRTLKTPLPIARPRAKALLAEAEMRRGFSESSTRDSIDA